jgi:Sigma-70 region 2
MHEHAERLTGSLVTADQELEREFESRLADSSKLAFRVAFSVLRQREDAEDVAQEAFAKAYRSLNQLRDRTRFRTIVKRFASVCGLVAALTFGVVDTARGQDEAQKKQQEPAEAAADRDRAKAQAVRDDLQRLVPLSVDVTVTRFQGEKKISSMPYMLAVNANKLGQAGPALLRMGAKVPVSTIAAPPGNAAGPTGPLAGPVNYQDIGTNIDCTAKVVEEGFELRVSVSDTSVYASIQDKATPTVGDMPVFRSFQSTNTLVLKDGQSREFTAATDRVSGEVIRIAVTLRVVK